MSHTFSATNGSIVATLTPIWLAAGRVIMGGGGASETVKIHLADGDVYVMSEHAVGEKWKSKGAHWRHATGSAKYAGDPVALWEAKQGAKARKRARGEA